jgi:DNA-binding NarL/FixJ family response regulator
VLLADDHGVVRQGVRTTLEADGGFEIVAEAENGSEVLPLVHQHEPQLVVLDLRLPGMDGLRCLELLRQRYPEVRVVVLSVADGGDPVREALERGAAAYVLKSIAPDELADALRRALVETIPEPVGAAEPLAASRSGLTERETVILRCVARGMTNRAIAKELWVAEQTVKFHLTNIYRKLDVVNRTDAARAAFTLGIAENPLLGADAGAPRTG